MSGCYITENGSIEDTSQTSQAGLPNLDTPCGAAMAQLDVLIFEPTVVVGDSDGSN